MALHACKAADMFRQLLTFARFFLCATAHGGVWKYEIEGKTYDGYKWWEPDAGQVSMQYRWPNRDPFHFTNESDLACNINGTPTSPSIHAPIHAGSVIKAHYDKNFRIPGEGTGGDWDTWGHKWGPIFVYMAECPGGDCGNVDTKAPIWFKVYEGGLINGTWTTGYWAMEGLYQGGTLDYTIPKDMKPGRYLIRHELIALHTQWRQFYPECAQIEVIGEGNNIPNPDYMRIAFPGGYAESDPGLNLTTWDFWVGHENDTYYPMPGPPVWRP